MVQVVVTASVGVRPARLAMIFGGKEALARRLRADIQRFRNWTRFDEPAVRALLRRLLLLAIMGHSLQPGI